MNGEDEKNGDTSCRECKYIFFAAFAVLIGFFVVTFLLRGDALTTSLSGNTTISGSAAASTQ